jgi:hypothetical protein
MWIYDREDALKAVAEDGMNLRRCSDDLQADQEIVKIAINNTRYALQFAAEKLQKDEELTAGIEKDDNYYFNMVDAWSGKKYDIPMLYTLDPDYYFKYVYFMKLKEGSPSAFEAAMRWD